MFTILLLLLGAVSVGLPTTTKGQSTIESRVIGINLGPPLSSGPIVPSLIVDKNIIEKCQYEKLKMDIISRNKKGDR